MSADEEDHEFRTFDLRDGQQKDTIGHAHGNYQMLREADQGDNVDVPADTMRDAQLETLREVSAGADTLADVLEELRSDLDADVEAPLADCQIAFRDMAAVLEEIADALDDEADGDELAERLHGVMHS